MLKTHGVFCMLYIPGLTSQTRKRMFKKTTMFSCSDGTTHATEKEAAIHERRQLEKNHNLTMNTDGISMNGSKPISWDLLKKMKQMYMVASDDKSLYKMVAGAQVQIAKNAAEILPNTSFTDDQKRRFGKTGKLSYSTRSNGYSGWMVNYGGGYSNTFPTKVLTVITPAKNNRNHEDYNE